MTSQRDAFTLARSYRTRRDRERLAERDQMCHGVAAEIAREHPRWLVLWGLYSREFWAFPNLPVERGTIVHAPDPEMLLIGMTEVETMAMQHSRQGGSSHLPR
jgi:hypothetical protein